MRPVVRLTRQAFDGIALDLSRPHPFALERVGFVFSKLSFAGPEVAVVFPVAYVPVSDEHYIEDDSVGVRIGTEAIRFAHQHALTTRLGCLHVHMHPGAARPWFSRVDLETLAGLSPSLRRMAPGAAHGGLVLAHDRASGLLWLPSASEPVEADVTVVGYPMLLERSLHRDE